MIDMMINLCAKQAPIRFAQLGNFPYFRKIFMDLLEREPFLAILHSALGRAGEGEGRCVFVTGEAGIGKTSLVRAFCESIHCPTRGARRTTLANPALLTGRELDVLERLKDGMANKEIATSLYISAKTVDNHISSILFKLDAPSRVKAVQQALRLGILP
jgi:DNA-binding NarL/FixJ family response regulator